MANIMDFFKMLIIVQLFFSFGITSYTHALPDDAKVYLNPSTEVTSNINITSIAADVSGSVDTQRNIPLVDVGSLVFYSGNLIIDLLLNFLTALPQMFILLISGIANLISIPFEFKLQLQLFATAAITVLYVIALLQFLTGIRSGRVA